MPKKQPTDEEIINAKISARTNIIVALITGFVTILVTLITVIWGPIWLKNMDKEPTPTVEPTSTPRDWYVIFELEFPSNYWAEGIHKYLFKADCPFGINSTGIKESSYSFSVKQTAEVQNTIVYIRRGGLYSVEIFGDKSDNTINSLQKTTAIYSPFTITFEDAKRLRDECKVDIQIDDGEFISLAPTRIDKLP